jgi:hypothetical protein
VILGVVIIDGTPASFFSFMSSYLW